MKNAERKKDKDKRIKNTVYFIGSKNNKLANKLFELWDYVLPLMEKPKTSPLTNNSYKVLKKDVVLTPANMAIHLSLYEDSDTNEPRFFISIENTERENGGRFGCGEIFTADKHMIEMYNYAKSLRAKYPGKWRKLPKNQDVNTEKEIVETKTDWEINYKNEITNLCDRLKIKVKFASGLIIFYTPLGSWMVDETAVINQYNLKLYHKNRHKDVDNWHKQRFKSSNIKAVIRYIHNHDYGKYKISSKTLK